MNEKQTQLANKKPTFTDWLIAICRCGAISAVGFFGGYGIAQVIIDRRELNRATKERS
jgi:hypothetical protein